MPRHRMASERQFRTTRVIVDFQICRHCEHITTVFRGQEPQTVCDRCYASTWIFTSAADSENEPLEEAMTVWLLCNEARAKRILTAFYLRSLSLIRKIYETKIH